MDVTLSWKPELASADQPLYVSIIKALAVDIEQGELTHGTRLPTQRELADALGVALGTVTKAYSEAERRGLIHSQGRRGTFVGIEETKDSPLSELMDAGVEVIDLSKNHPIYPGDPDLAQALHKLARRRDCQRLLEYGPSAGLPQHREAGARWIGTWGWEVAPENVIVTAGGQHAMLVILAAVVNPGEVVLTSEYTYPGLKSVASMLGLELIGVAMDADGPIPDNIRTICRQRRVRAMYCNPTLHNPVGYVMPERRRRELAETARQNDFLIIEDEIVRPLVPDPPPFISSFAPDHCLAIVSASKVIAAGLRVAFIASPPGYRSRLIDALRSPLLVSSPRTTELLVGWLSDGTADAVIAGRRTEFVARMEIARHVLAGFDMNYTPHSCHIWLKLPPPWSTTEFAIQAHRNGVAIAPAELFAVNNRQCAVNAVRISLGSVSSRDVVRRGLELIARILKSPAVQETTAI